MACNNSTDRCETIDKHCDHSRLDTDIQDTCSKVPRLVIILSGKRKCGKDHVSNILMNYIGSARQHLVAVLRIAGPIKSEFSKSHELDFSRLLDSSEYKEQYREAMVTWSELYRARVGWNCFLEQAIEEARGYEKPVWILNDARRVCDIEYFKDFPKDTIVKLRIEANDETRSSRGWSFTENVDDKTTECGLDNFEDWTHVIDNSASTNETQLLDKLKPILARIEEALQLP